MQNFLFSWPGWFSFPEYDASTIYIIYCISNEYCNRLLATPKRAIVLQGSKFICSKATKFCPLPRFFTRYMRGITYIWGGSKDCSQFARNFTLPSFLLSLGLWFSSLTAPPPQCPRIYPMSIIGNLIKPTWTIDSRALWPLQLSLPLSLSVSLSRSHRLSPYIPILCTIYILSLLNIFNSCYATHPLN